MSKSTKYNWHMYSDKGLLQYLDYIIKLEVELELKQELIEDIKKEQLERTKNKPGKIKHDT